MRGKPTQLSLFLARVTATKRSVPGEACQNAWQICHSPSFRVGGTYHLFPIGIGFEADSKVTKRIPRRNRFFNWLGEDILFLPPAIVFGTRRAISGSWLGYSLETRGLLVRLQCLREDDWDNRITGCSRLGQSSYEILGNWTTKCFRLGQSRYEKTIGTIEIRDTDDWDNRITRRRLGQSNYEMLSIGTIELRNAHDWDDRATTY